MKFNFKWKSARARPLAILFVSLAAGCSLLLMGVLQGVTFFPSSQWNVISALISLVLGLICSVPICQRPHGKRENPVVWMFFFSPLFYFLLAYGIGSAVTARSHVIVEKDIVGTKVLLHSKKYGDTYYIDTSDLPESPFDKLYITRDDFKSIPHEVHLHVTLNQSSFGMTVEQMHFLPEK